MNKKDNKKYDTLLLQKILFLGSKNGPGRPSPRRSSKKKMFLLTW